MEDDSAFPTVDANSLSNGEMGITKMEHFANSKLDAIISKQSPTDGGHQGKQVHMAIQYAKELIRQLKLEKFERASKKAQEKENAEIL